MANFQLFFQSGRAKYLSAPLYTIRRYHILPETFLNEIYINKNFFLFYFITVQIYRIFLLTGVLFAYVLVFP